MTSTEIRNGFNEVIEKAAAAGIDTSKMEVAREFFTNPEFKANLQDFAWSINKGRSA